MHFSARKFHRLGLGQSERVNVALRVRTDRDGERRRGAQNVHLFFCTAPELCNQMSKAISFFWSEFRSCADESRGGRPGLPVLTSLMVSVDVKQH